MTGALGDLATYPHWNDFVVKATPAEPQPSDDGPAWSTTLQLELGPVTRTWDIRFVRDVFEQDHGEATIRFVGTESKKAAGSPWFFGVEVEPVASLCSVVFSIAHAGRRSVVPVGPLLHHSLSSSSERLPAYLAEQ